MLQTLKIIRWASIPVLLIVALFSGYAGRYEALLDIVVCLGSLSFLQRAVWRREYFVGAALVAIVVIFSPLFVVTKLFLLMTVTCLLAFLTLLTAFRQQRVPAL